MGPMVTVPDPTPGGQTFQQWMERNPMLMLAGTGVSAAGAVVGVCACCYAVDKVRKWWKSCCARSTPERLPHHPPIVQGTSETIEIETDKSLLKRVDEPSASFPSLEI